MPNVEKQKKKYGHLPAKNPDVEPWKQVNIDCIGPYTVKTPNGIKELIAMTMINPATSWFEIAELKEISSDEFQRAFDHYWLCRYPRPQEISYDNASSFKLYFKQM